MNFENNDSIKEIEFLLRRICCSIKRKGREILEDFDITPPQFDALQSIMKNEEITISELSTNLYLAPSTITDLVDRMEKNDLVERVRCTKDRRVVKIKALKKGCDIINQVLERRCYFIEESIKDTSEDEKKELIKYLQILYNSSYCSQHNE